MVYILISISYKNKHYYQSQTRWKTEKVKKKPVILSSIINTIESPCVLRLSTYKTQWIQKPWLLNHDHIGLMKFGSVDPLCQFPTWTLRTHSLWGVGWGEQQHALQDFAAAGQARVFLNLPGSCYGSLGTFNVLCNPP